MITKQNIESIYKQNRKLPESPYDLNMPLLFIPEMEQHALSIDRDENLVIGSVSTASPFHKIALKRIHAILDFDELVAIVMHSSIIFLRKNDRSVNVHLKQPTLTLGDRIRHMFANADE